MRKSILTTLVLGAALTTIGCPPPENSGTTGGTDKKGETPAGETKTETPAGETKTETPAGETKTEAPAAQKVDLSHVKVGQKYVIKMETSGMEMHQIYEVTGVTDTAVECKLHNKVKMPGAAEFTDSGEPSPFKWEVPAPTGETTGETKTDTKTGKETITAAGQSWDCLWAETDGTKVWVAQKNGINTFPPFIKMDGPTTKAELIEIKE